MKSLLRNMRLIFVFFIILGLLLLTGLSFQQRRASRIFLRGAGEDREALGQRYRYAGAIYSKDGQRLAASENGERVYAEDPELARAFLHVVGDYTHNISNTIENQYQDILLGTKRPIWTQFMLDLHGKGLQGNDLYTSLDSRIQRYAYRLLAERRGAIVGLNYRTGEVVAAVSTPTTDVDNVIRYEDIPDSALFNRVFDGSYLPGSTFKIVSSAAWLSSPQYDPNLVVQCIRPRPLIEPDGVREDYNIGENHGEVDLDQGFATSCNYFFGTLGLKLGYDSLKQMAEQLGYNRSLKVGELQVRKGIFAPSSQSEAQLTWMAIGQPQGQDQILLSPMQLCMDTATIAAGGQVPGWSLAQSWVDPDGGEHAIPATKSTEGLEATVAERLRSVMQRAVETGYQAAAVEGYAGGGKTGTVEVEGQERPNRLFTGFLGSEEAPYAISMVYEDSYYAPIEDASGLLSLLAELKP